MTIEEEAKQIIENARAAYERGEIDAEDLCGICRRAGVDVELKDWTPE